MTKKFIHSLFALLLILPLTSAITSCSDDDDKDQPKVEENDDNDDPTSGKDAIEGSWSYYEEFTEGSYKGTSTMTFDFYDGAFDAIAIETFMGETERVNIYGTYTKKNGKYTMKITGSSDHDWFAPGETFTATISKNKMTATKDNDSIIFYRDDD